MKTSGNTWKALALAAALWLPTLGEAQTSLEAHEHGVVQLLVALEGEVLQTELEAPAASLIGFEYLPETPQDRQTFTQGVRALAQPESLLLLPEAAACVLSGIQVHNTLFPDPTLQEEPEAHGHDGHDGHEGAKHSEFRVQWNWLCHAPENLNTLDVQLLKAFPLAEEIRVQWLMQGQQGAQELTEGETMIQGWN